MKNFSKQNYQIALFSLLFVFLSTASIFAQKNTTRQARAERQATTEEICQNCCDCVNLKAGSKAYKKAGCKMILPICEALVKSGTGPVVVGGSKNEYGSNNCVCSQKKEFSTQKVNYLLVGLNGLKKAVRVNTLVEVQDRKGNIIYSSKRKKFDAFLLNKGQKSKSLKNVQYLKLAAKQNALVNIPIKLNSKAVAGRGKIKVIFFTIDPKTKRRVILKKYNEVIQITNKRVINKRIINKQIKRQ